MRNYTMYHSWHFARAHRTSGADSHLQPDAAGSAGNSHDGSVAPMQAFGKTVAHSNFQPV
jgi:hypothetical protein